MNPHIQKLQQSIAPYRDAIIHHKVYQHINSLEDLNSFMQYHIYAVWDFMSILKTLQNNLTCTSVPWFPKGSAATRHLINEIVVGEESDVDADGNRISHFELYLTAMEQCGADTASIKTFTKTLSETSDFNTAYSTANTPNAARAFVDFTFKIIHSRKDYLQAAIFTFGREDLIPGMFLSIINDLYQKLPDSISLFKYYLDRHIEIDGDHHSHLALQMTANLCGDDEVLWKEAEAATIASLERRIALWDGVYEEIMQRKESI